MQIQFPPLRKRAACGGLIIAPGTALLVGGHKPVAGGLAGCRTSVVKALPDFSLPEVIVGFDLVLEALLARWREDGGTPTARQKRATEPSRSGWGWGP